MLGSAVNCRQLRLVVPSDLAVDRRPIHQIYNENFDNLKLRVRLRNLWLLGRKGLRR